MQNAEFDETLFTVDEVAQVPLLGTVLLWLLTARAEKRKAA
jgi:hypothetical protein